MSITITSETVQRMTPEARGELIGWLVEHGVNPDQTLCCWTTDVVGDHLHAVCYLLDASGRRYQIPDEPGSCIAAKEIITLLKRPMPEHAAREARLLA